MLDWIRRSLFFDSLNIYAKAHFSSRRKKYKERLKWLERVRRQGHVPLAVEAPQIFIDISSLVGCDGQTGIHRFVRSVATCVSRMGAYRGYRLSLVYASKYREGYWHAFSYECSVLGKRGLPEIDPPIAFKKGDIFFELDWNMKLAALQRPYYERMVAAGVCVFFQVFDIIPLLLDDLFSPKARSRFEDWLMEASRYTGVLCNSQAVVEEYRAWRQHKALPADFALDFFHLGCDIENSHPSKGLPENAPAVLEAMRSTPSILMVSALHPRKGYAQALAAFEALWREGQEVKLVIVGKDDPHSNGMAQRLREHPEQGRRLVWLDNISDEYLDLVYKACSAVLFASRAEGFGLAVGEGARYGKPLILRDIPVFRELAGEGATYFSGLGPESLAACLQEWLEAFRQGKVRPSTGVTLPTWEESTLNMLEKLIKAGEG